MAKTIRRLKLDKHGQTLVPRSDQGWRYEISSLTSDFSSFNSATDASIFARLKSFIGRPCTISHFPPRTRTGNDEINPFSTP